MQIFIVISLLMSSSTRTPFNSWWLLLIYFSRQLSHCHLMLHTISSQVRITTILISVMANQGNHLPNFFNSPFFPSLIPITSPPSDIPSFLPLYHHLLVYLMIILHIISLLTTSLIFLIHHFFPPLYLYPLYHLYCLSFMPPSGIPSSLPFMSSSPYLSNDHSPCTCSPPSKLPFSRFDGVGSVAESLGFVTASLASQSKSPVGLNLVVDLSSYPLQQHTGSSLSTFSFLVRQHHMVLHPWLSKTASLMASSISSASPISLTSKPSAFLMLTYMRLGTML